MYSIKDKSAVTSFDFFKKKNLENPGYNRKESSKDKKSIKDDFTKLNRTSPNINLLKNQSPKLSVGILRHKGQFLFIYF